MDKSKENLRDDHDNLETPNRPGIRLLKPGFVSSDYFSSLRRIFIELVEHVSKEPDIEKCSVRVIFEDVVIAEDVMSVLKSVLDVLPTGKSEKFEDIDTIVDFVQLQTWRRKVSNAKTNKRGHSCYTFILSTPPLDFLHYLRYQGYDKAILCDGNLVNLTKSVKENVAVIEERMSNFKRAIPSDDIHELIITNFLSTL